jgi:hypothetical protein
MKRLLLITLLFIVGYFATAQSNPLLKKATLVAQKEPLEKVLATLTAQTGVRFSYNSQLIDPQTKVTVSAQNITIKEILTLILPDSVSFKDVGEHVVFYKKKEERSQKSEDRSQKLEDRSQKSEETEKEESINRWLQPTEEEKSYSSNGDVSDNCLDSVSLTKDTENFNQDEDMKAQIAALMMAAAIATTPLTAQDTIKQETEKEESINRWLQPTDEAELQIPLNEGNDETELQTSLSECKPLQVTFIYPLGTGFVKTADRGYHFSLNILGGTTGYIKGFEAGSLFNVNRYGAIGAQFAGLCNITAAGKLDMMSRNAQFAGLFNITRKGTSVQFGGIFNKGDTAYFQAAGIFNIAHKSGAQFAGIFNHADTVYFQAAGIANTAKQTKCQIAGIANVAQESVCQIAGIFNATKKGRFQMGLINVRDTADGVSLGLINIVKHGGVLEAGIEAGEFVHTALTFRSGVQRLYSIISVGCNYTEKLWTVGAGLGTSFKLVGNLGLNLELTHTTLYKNVRQFPYSRLIQFSPILNYRFAKHFKMYVGPSFNLFIRDYVHHGANGYLDTYKVKIPYSLYHYSNRSTDVPHTTLDMWIGVVGGIKF